MSNSAEFNTAAANVNKLKVKPTDVELLKLYSYFKQATVGDINTVRPGMLDFKGKSKWDAWESRKGVSKDEAEKEYIECANEIVPRLGME